MAMHKNASLTPNGREAMARSVIGGGLSNAAAARQYNATPNSVAKWVERFCAEGNTGLRGAFIEAEFKVERVMIGKGASFRSRRFAKALRAFTIKHLRTRPCKSKTNGKAEIRPDKPAGMDLYPRLPRL